MKVFYTFFLAFIFILHGDAQPGSSAAIPQKWNIADTVDSSTYNKVDSVVNNPDSVSATKDSSLIVSNDEIIAAKKFKTVSGVASFYGKSFEGTKTATGETFRHGNLTAASNSFPLNTWVRVTNIKNDRCVIVRINDRMHPRMAKKGRVIDLSYSAAKKIGLTGKIGLTKVKVEEVEKGAAE
jgi:rare lipoprotein A